MRVEFLTKDEAEKISLAKKYGIISDGCVGVWGEGDTLEEAEIAAAQNIREFANPGDIDELKTDTDLLENCRIVVIHEPTQ